MKIFMLLFAGMLMVNIAAQAQDTTQVAPADQTLQQQPSDQYLPKDYVQVKVSDVPASLRTTLKGPEYQGWESGMVYRSKTNSGYMVRVNDGTRTNSFYFDKGGKRVE